MGRPATKLLAALAAAGLAAVSCTQGTATAPPAPTDAYQVSPGAPIAPAGASEIPGKLLVRQSDGSLLTLRADGSEPTVLATGDPQSLQVLQAVWSPDGERVAWTQVDDRDGGVNSRMVVIDASGEQREALLPVIPFYLFWDPTSSRIAFLGREESLLMGVVEPRPDAVSVTEIGRGAPFYFSWAPDGLVFVAHVALENLDTVELSGTSAPVERRRVGTFQAPSWSPDGSSIFYARSSPGEGQDLVSRDVSSGRVTVLAPLDGVGYLVLSPDGSRVAFHGRDPETETDFYDRSLPEVATDLGVSVVGVDGEGLVRASEEPAISWSWSPDGSKLAILEPVYQADGIISFRWRIWDGDGSFVTDPFIGSIGWLQEYAPHFSQFAQSASIWAPDGSAFAYPADQAEGPTQIWVQQVTEGSAAYPVAEGTSVSWSPADL
jgi:Tol biopolymer transport system component